MSTETTMTAEAANTTEGQAASPAASTTTEGQTAQVSEQTATQQQTTEGQSTEGQKAEGAQAEGDQGSADQKVGAPEKYEFKAPDGQSFDDSVLAAYSEAAKELDLPQDKAQLMLDKLAPALAEKTQRMVVEARTQWIADAKADKEIGGDKFDENVGIAKKARDTFGTPELRALLDTSGIGDHPEVIRFFSKVGKAISEDRFVGGQQGQTHPQTVAQRMYPNMNP